jgi:predicted enzyme related to lactoylglutathione lyase
MTTHDTTWPEGTPCWADLAVDDFGKAQTFYSQLFGWEIPTGLPEFGGYSTATKDHKIVVGLMPKMDPAQPSAWTTYLASDDIDATLAKVRDNGGQVVADAMDVGDMGRMAVAIDPAGAFVGLWQGGSHTGFNLANEPGSVTWNENFSRDWEANKAFYTAVAGWEYDDMSEGDFQYATFKVNDHAAGGIGHLGADVPAGTPPYWSVYFAVADTDASVETLKQLGGSVDREPTDTPFGRTAMVADDQGNRFNLIKLA